MSHILGSRLSAGRMGSLFSTALARSRSVQMIGLTLRLTRWDSCSSVVSMREELAAVVRTNTSMSLLTSSVFAACEPKMNAACTPDSFRRASAI
jgi:hypothetical protein